MPNSCKTAKAVYSSIIHPIDKNSLITFVEQICIQKTKKRPISQSGDNIIQKIPRAWAPHLACFALD